MLSSSSSPPLLPPPLALGTLVGAGLGLRVSSVVDVDSTSVESNVLLEAAFWIACREIWWEKVMLSQFGHGMR